MARWSQVLAWLWRSSAAQRDRDDRELKEEIAFHVATETERRIAAGRSPDEARASATRDFGNVLLVERSRVALEAGRRVSASCRMSGSRSGP